MRLIMWCPSIHFVETMLSIICQFRNTSFWSTIFLVGSGHSHFVVGRMSRLKNHEIFVMVGQAVVEHPRQRSANAPQWLQTFRSSLYSSACGQITSNYSDQKMMLLSRWYLSDMSQTVYNLFIFVNSTKDLEGCYLTIFDTSAITSSRSLDAALRVSHVRRNYSKRRRRWLQAPSSLRGWQAFVRHLSGVSLKNPLILHHGCFGCTLLTQILVFEAISEVLLLLNLTTNHISLLTWPF